MQENQQLLQSQESSLGLSQDSVSPSPSENNVLFNISLDGFRQLVTNQIDLNCLYILESISLSIDISKEIKTSKVAAWFQTLLRKGYITENNTITPPGADLLRIVKGNHDIKRAIVRLATSNEQGFEQWWKEFPSTDVFEYKGIKFVGTRSLRSDKPACTVLFSRVINEGEYTAEDLIRALKYEIILKKEDSVKNRTNKLSFLSNSATYLRQRKFDGFVEVSKNSPIFNNQASTNSSSSMYSGFDI